MGKLDGLGDGLQQLRGPARGERLITRQLGQAATLHQFHGEERLSVVSANLVNRDNVGMRQAGRRLVMAGDGNQRGAANEVLDNKRQ